ncbi:hypothetical protein EYW49_22025 [Siculibacillus lacustris]|uniref:DUF2612 domain-containing protein n=1 Tax=Siculibacillus lacustris TaxID=1549641 RepID=A0A4Q9VFC3_9HYPH|nr:hypothetical protein [Siculibacillus lacustris]TBW32619.1 hypothetical protein EYW49_22025 [Siculibacillus lacustris]
MTGDSADMLARLKSLLPGRWFAGIAPLRDAVLGALADQLAWAYGLFQWVITQSRISTATGAFLDLISFDFLGLGLRRRTGELDDVYRVRVLKEILRERATRAGMVAALTDLTGRAPVIFEPRRPADTGSYGLGGCAYGAIGGYGSVIMPTEYFMTAYRPATAGIPYVGGYGIAAAYTTPSATEYADITSAGAQIADAEIYETIEKTKALGTTAWVNIQS